MALTLEQENARAIARLERETDPDFLYLGPRCQVLNYEGRQWCEDAQDCDEDECRMKAVKYIRFDLAVAGGFVPPKE